MAFGKYIAFVSSKFSTLSTCAIYDKKSDNKHGPRAGQVRPGAASLQSEAGDSPGLGRAFQNFPRGRQWLLKLSQLSASTGFLKKSPRRAVVERRGQAAYGSHG